MTSTEFLAALRQLNWTQRAFSRRYGVDKSTVNAWATGKWRVSPWVDTALRDATTLARKGLI